MKDHKFENTTKIQIINIDGYNCCLKIKIIKGTSTVY